MNEIEIRLIAKEDFTQLLNVIERNRGRLLMYFPKTSKSIVDLQTAKKFVEHKLSQALQKEQYYFVITLKTNSEIIGSVLLKNIDWSIPRGELAYFIDHAYEGKGFTTCAVNFLVQYSFNELGFEKLYIKIDPENWGSKRVALKNAFEKEGFFKKEFRTGQGEFRDVERYGLVRGKR